MLTKQHLDELKQLAKCLAGQFGSGCEVVIHELSADKKNSAIVHIENGHVSGRKLGDGPSHVVLEHLAQAHEDSGDQIGYLTRTPDGKVLKSSTVFIRDEAGQICAIFSVNFDISVLSALDLAVGDLIRPNSEARREPEQIPLNVSDLLDDLIRQSDELVGKPVAMMTKEDKIRAIRFLNDTGALLITKSGDKISKHFNISKYTLYSYLDSSKQEVNNHD